MDNILNIINTIRRNKDLELLNSLEPNIKLREDLGFDSLDLAELTVRIENEFGIDVFEDGVVSTIGEIIKKLYAEK